MTNASTPAPHARDSTALDAPFTGVTRLAPSPTGTLHLGNCRTFLITWAIARQRGLKVTLRIEDLDLTRVREGAADEAIDLLLWLGIDWDEGPLVQSHDLEPYRDAMKRLCDKRMAYACALSRKQMDHAASAPHGEDGEARAPLRTRAAIDDPSALRFDRHDTNYRFIVPDERIEIDDLFAGHSSYDPFNECGDFIIWTKLGVPAYQLAVVVDDARQGVTDVIRGDDLLPSAARQHLLYRSLGLPSPNWWHLPLVVDDDGRRLAKRHGQTHLNTYRESGIPGERIIGLLAAWCGIGDRQVPEPMTASEFRDRFRCDMLPSHEVCFTKDDHAWLTRD